jgi:hypothetical protein
MAKAPAPRRLAYPGNKYAAFHLLLCRWLRHHAQAVPYQYVTLGGTEFRDVISVHFVDPDLLGQAVSFEGNAGRYELASQTAAALRAGGVQIEVQQGNIFSTFTRQADAPHIFFIDLLGICAFGNYVQRFGEMFQNETIRENDCLFITSFVTARVGWPRVYHTFDGEFRLLGAGTIAEKKNCYTRLHPSFTLYRALRHVDLQDTLSLTCFGGIAYRSRSPMGVYGYAVDAGQTQLTDFADSPWHASSYG